MKNRISTSILHCLAVTLLVIAFASPRSRHQSTAWNDSNTADELNKIIDGATLAPATNPDTDVDINDQSKWIDLPIEPREF